MTSTSIDRGRLMEELRARIGQVTRGQVSGKSSDSARPASLAFGWPPIDAALPGNGLATGALHEVTDTAAALFIAGILARLTGSVLWVIERQDLFAPALAGVGLHTHRVIYAEADNSTAVLLVMEEGLRHAGLAGVVGEVSGRLTLTASRRLQLAAEASGVTAFALRRPYKTTASEPNAAVTRWRVAASPSDPPMPWAPGVPGLGRARWQIDLVRCRGGEPGSWIVEACDATGRLGLVFDVPDRSIAPQSSSRVAR